MKMYMGFDRIAGPGEAAVLIFANSVKEARKLAFNSVIGDMVESYIDIKATLIKDAPWLEELQMCDAPHFINSPNNTCYNCNRWGISVLVNGLCSSCRDIIQGEKS